MPASSFGIEARAEPTRVGVFENIDIGYAANEKSFQGRERERGGNGGVATCRKNDIWIYSPSIYSSLTIPINGNCACRFINQKLNPNFGDNARSFPVIFHPKTALNQVRSTSREPRPAEKISALNLGDMVSGLFGSGGSNPGGLGKAHCEQAKNDRENCYNDSRNSRNDGVVFCNRLSSAAGGNSAPDEGDDFFLPLMLCAALAACLGATLLVSR